MARGYPDFEGDKSGLYSQPEWAAKEGTDKNLAATANGLAIGANFSAYYTVPEGKTLYITGMSFLVVGNAAADRDLIQIGMIWLLNATTAENLCRMGGHGGGGMSFPKPLVIESEEVYQFFVYNKTNHVVDMTVMSWGYEI